jgi:hypothetical protein
MAEHFITQSYDDEDDLDAIAVRCSCGWSARYSRRLGMAEAGWCPPVGPGQLGRHELRWPQPRAAPNGSG